MELGEALYRAMAGKGSYTEVADFDEALDYLTAAYGSASAAARAIGEPPSTVRHWATGKRAPKADRADRITSLVRQLERRARLGERRERKLRHPGSLGQKIDCHIAVSADEEERQLDVTQYLDDGVEDALVDAYLAGDSPEELADVFHSFVSGSDFYADVFEPGGPYDTDITNLGWR